MRHTHSCIWIHLIWGTKNRERVLFNEEGKLLFNHLINKGKELNCSFEKLNIQPEHVHALINLPTDLLLKDFIQQIKGGSSYWLNQEVFQSKFSWQRGYGAYSVSASQLDKVKKYIDNQTEHHKHLTYSQEYDKWRREYGILDD
ncbi:MAG: IS200/IS605 family transposase [Marinilabiliaceae bacterium]